MTSAGHRQHATSKVVTNPHPNACICLNESKAIRAASRATIMPEEGSRHLEIVKGRLPVDVSAVSTRPKGSRFTD